MTGVLEWPITGTNIGLFEVAGAPGIDSPLRIDLVPGMAVESSLSGEISVAQILDITKQFSGEEACLKYLEKLRWPHGVECVKCAGKKISRIVSSGKTGKPRHLYQCLICRAQFTVRTGTIFRDSHLPLKTWFKAIGLVCSSTSRIKTATLQAELNVHYRTAAFILSRIYKAMERGGVLEA